MPRVELGAPRPIGSGTYTGYRDWLLHHFFDHVCAYCLLRDINAEVDHFEPVKFRPERAHDPRNLVLACGRCNGAGGKGDYHPAHQNRSRKRGDRTGHHVIDVRRDDFEQLFAVHADGKIDARPGPEEDRVRWNIALLKLDLGSVVRERGNTWRLLEGCRLALECIKTARTQDERRRCELLLQQLLPEAAQRFSFFEVYGLPVPADLRVLVIAKRDELRGDGR
jgi:uncharacterized protein (TIGR02646 family)